MPFLIMLILLAILSALLTACGEKEATAGSGNLGRYVEQQAAAVKGANQAMGMYRNEDGKLVFYVSRPAEGRSSLERCVLSPDSGELVQTPVEWAEGLGDIMGISETGDGTAYLLTAGENPEVYRFRDGTAEAVPIPDMAQESGTDTRQACGIRSLPGGDFLLLYGIDGVSRYSGADAALLRKYPVSGYDWSVGIYNGSLLAPGLGKDELLEYQLDSGEQIQNTVFDNLSLSACQRMDEAGIYLADNTGIYRLDRGEREWRKLADGELTSLSLPSVTIGDIISDGEGGFYAALLDGDGLRIMRYVYDADIPREPDTILNIFSLTENMTLRQTAAVFQQEHPDVRIRFQIMQEETAAVGAEDVIRTLNTELLNGKGPDILMLDGLPVKSYMEKGVLADLTNQVNALSDRFVTKLSEAYRYNGRCYGVPSRFTIPVMTGERDALDAMRSLEELAACVENERGKWFLRPSDRLSADGGMLMDYYDVCSLDFAGGEEIDASALAAYLSAMLRIQRVQEENSSSMERSMADGAAELFEWMGICVMPADGEEEIFYVQALPDAVNSVSVIPSGLNPETGSGLELEPAFGGTGYAPKWAVGITAASAQKELACQFIELLLSQTVQDVYLYDGFPVNARSLDIMLENALKGQENDVKFQELFDRLDTPVLVDRVVREAVQSQLKGLLDGTVDPQQAASAVVEKTRLYLME